MCRYVDRLLLAVALSLPTAGEAQLLKPNQQGVTMGHVLYNVTDVEAHREFWVRGFDARPVAVGKLEGVTLPGLVILFRRQNPTGPGDGETINHLGLKVLKLSDFTARFDAAGWRYDPPRVGRENTVQTYVHGPDGFRVELVEDARLPVASISHHLHYWLTDPVAVQEWYVRNLEVAPTMRGPYESGDVPGMNLTFSPLGSQPGPGVATLGRLMDSIGLEVENLDALTTRLQARGLAVRAHRPDPELGIQAATFVDPWGVTVRLTQGLAGIAGVADFDYVDGYVVPDL